MSMTKAIINNGKVTNLIVCSDEGLIGMTFPADTTVWDCGQYPVRIGDDFENGVFSRDGEPLDPSPTEIDRIDELQSLLETLLGENEENTEEEGVPENE